jgi:hypothetical protein
MAKKRYEVRDFDSSRVAIYDIQANDVLVDEETGLPMFLFDRDEKPERIDAVLVHLNELARMSTRAKRWWLKG